MFKSIMLMRSVTAGDVAAQAGTIEMKVNGLVCAFCARGIEKTFHKNPEVEDVVVSLEDRLVAVQTKDGTDISDHRAASYADRRRLRHQVDRADGYASCRNPRKTEEF